MVFSLLLITTFFLPCIAGDVFFYRGDLTEADGRIGAFSQNYSGDCFFLAALIALGHDPDGRRKINSAFFQRADKKQWQITFPNLPELQVLVTEQDIENYQLTDSSGHGVSLPAWGDVDVRMLEIAADKIWRKYIKPEGLWDDVPMNVVSMFSNAEQLLIWNRSKAANENIWDIEKYHRIKEGVVKEIMVTSVEKAKALLKNIIIDDQDGISMILIDYINYHAVAIVDIDFDNNKYSYINTYSSIRIEESLDDLFEGLSNGLYAVNYLEIE